MRGIVTWHAGYSYMACGWRLLLAIRCFLRRALGSSNPSFLFLGTGLELVFHTIQSAIKSCSVQLIIFLQFLQGNLHLKPSWVTVTLRPVTRRRLVSTTTVLAVSLLLLCLHRSSSSTEQISADVCSYGGCGNERYKSSSGTRYKYCGTRKFLPPCPMPLTHPTVSKNISWHGLILDCCGASDCMNESWKNEYTGTRYKYCENRACCLCCMLQTQLKRSPDRCWQGDCTRQAVSRTDRCSARKYRSVPWTQSRG